MDEDEIRQKYSDMALSLSLTDEDLLLAMGYDPQQEPALLEELRKSNPLNSSDPETGDDSSPEPDPPEQP